jgi:uncharacterized protein YdeI (YjbR/CyaY-like superfamily)
MEIASFPSPHDYREWLALNHDRSRGVWLRIYKKHSGLETVSNAEALDIALCCGWIDGQKKAYDDKSWLQKFTPSAWSKRNIEHVKRLVKSGGMTAAGIKEVKAAKADGRWKAAYDSFASAAMPDEFLEELKRNKAAKAFYDTLN